MTAPPARWKLLLYAHDWAPQVGGVEIVTMALARGFAAWSTAHPEEQIETTVVTNTPAAKMDDTQLPFRVVRRPGKRQLSKLVRSADVIHVSSPAIPPLALAWLYRKPVLIEHSNYQSICPNGLLLEGPGSTVCPGHFMASRYSNCVRCNSVAFGWGRSARALLLTFPRRWLARHVTRNIAPSRFIASRVALPRTEVIPHGVPQLPNALRRPHDTLPATFAYVGRLIPEKGMSVLLRAAGQLAQQGRSFHLKIVGDGPERQRLEAMTDELGLRDRTEFLGTVPGDAIPALLCSVTAVVMPSVCEDIAPLVAVEQMMQGQALIASDIAGLGEIVDGAGLRFVPGNAEDLAARMGQVLDDRDGKLIQELRQAARKRAVDLFSADRMVREHLRLYRELLPRHEG